MPRKDLMRLMVTIVDRGKGSAAVDIYRSQKLHFDYLCLGFGTANSQILDYLGLEATEKDVVFTLAPAYRMKRSSSPFLLPECADGFTKSCLKKVSQVRRKNRWILLQNMI